MDDCIFSKIISRKVAGHIVDEDNDVIVFVSMEHHPLIVPKRHIRDIFELDEDTASLIVQKSLIVAKAMREGLGCDGIYVTQTNGVCAGQSVFHYHMHLYPRWNDQENRHQSRPREEIATRVREAMSSHV